MDSQKSISTDLFFKIRSRFQGLKLGESAGAITINPEDAVFFDFDYLDEEQVLGHVSISLAEPTSMKVYFSTGITENMNPVQKQRWYDFLYELRIFAKRRLMSFDTRDVAKDNLDKRDFEFLSQYNMPKQSEDNAMNESAMYGTKTISYQKLEDTRLIIKHSQALSDDMQPGARSRNIAALFIENSLGERHKYPFIHLAGARAMQRHVANGGVPYDAIGESIIKMSEEIAQLRGFSNYVVRNDLMNSETNSIVERSSEALNRLREQISKLSKQAHYEAYRDSFQAHESEEIPQEVIEDFTEKFTVKNFKEDIKSVFPVLYRLMKEQSKPLGYDDIVALTNTKEDVNQELTTQDAFEDFENWVLQLGEESLDENDTAVVETAKSPDHDFEEVELTAEVYWETEPEIKVTSVKLGDTEILPVISPDELTEIVALIQSGDYEEQGSEHLFYSDVGADYEYEEEERGARERGTGLQLEPDYPESYTITATYLSGNGKTIEVDLPQSTIESMEEQLYDSMGGSGGGYDDYDDYDRYDRYEASDPNHPEYNKADDYDLPPSKRGKGTDQYKLPDYEKHDSRHKRDFQKRAGTYKEESLDLKEVARFIYSFFDSISESFPKGNEGVAIMVGKKFGPRAEMIAREMIERLAPQQDTAHMMTGNQEEDSQPSDPIPFEAQELARIKALSGL